MPERDDPESAEFLARLKANDHSAWTQFVKRRNKPLLQIVQRALPARVRQKIGEDDIVQEAFRDLYVRACRRELACESEVDLWRVLISRARKRVLHELRKFLAARRDVRREGPWASAPPDAGSNQAEPLDPHSGCEPAVSVHDQFVGFVNSLEWVEQVIVHLRLELGTLEKVADALKWSLRKVQGIWEGICKKAREGKYGNMDGRMDGWKDEPLIGPRDISEIVQIADSRR